MSQRKIWNKFFPCSSRYKFLKTEERKKNQVSKRFSLKDHGNLLASVTDSHLGSCWLRVAAARCSPTQSPSSPQNTPVRTWVSSRARTSNISSVWAPWFWFLNPTNPERTAVLLHTWGKQQQVGAAVKLNLLWVTHDHLEGENGAGCSAWPTPAEGRVTQSETRLQTTTI